MPDDIWSKMKIKRHPPPEMVSHFVDRFILEMPEMFGSLQQLLHEQKDPVDVMVKFFAFLREAGFDSSYSDLDVYAELRERAIGESKK